MNDIWKDWEAHYKQLGLDPSKICKDGIFNDPKYKDTTPKILYVMKDTNDWPGGDLKELGLKYQMWHTTARWSAGIFRNFPDYKEVDNDKEKKEALSKIASINLKKISGGASADMKEINRYAHCDWELLTRQINSIDPKIIIACGTTEPLIWLFDLDVELNDLSSPIKIKDKDHWIIPFWHPSRHQGKKWYDKLKSVISRIKIV